MTCSLSVLKCVTPVCLWTMLWLCSSLWDLVIPYLHNAHVLHRYQYHLSDREWECVFVCGYFWTETWELLLSVTIDNTVPVFLLQFEADTPLWLQLMLMSFICFRHFIVANSSMCSCDQNRCIKLFHNFLLHIYCMIIIIILVYIPFWHLTKCSEICLYSRERERERKKRSSVLDVWDNKVDACIQQTSMWWVENVMLMCEYKHVD